MSTPQRLFADESLQCFNAVSELARGKRPLGTEATGTEALQILGQPVTARQLGVLGEPRVNVLALNRALDNLAK